MFFRDDCKKKMCKIWEHVPNWVTPPLTPLWEHKNLGTFYFSKTPTPPHEFGNIDFGITRCFDSQGPKLGGVTLIKSLF